MSARETLKARRIAFFGCAREAAAAALLRRRLPRMRNRNACARQGRPRVVDGLDQAILRELGSGQVLLWGGTDPRVSAGELAKRLRADRSTVRLRLRAWERAGFLCGFTTLPNVSLFGLGVVAAGVRVESAAAKARAMEDLALLDGMLSAMEHVGEWIGVAFADEGAAATRRRAQLLARLPGVVEVQPPMTHAVPRSHLAPTALQWRILRALRGADARAPLGRLAEDVGVSPNTFRAHYETLLRANALWSVPNLDFTRYTGAVLARLIVVFERGRSRADLARSLKDAGVAIMEHPSPELPPDGPALLSAHVQARSAGELEDLALTAQAIPGVIDVEVLHPKRFVVLGDWVDDRIGQALAVATRSRA